MAKKDKKVKQKRRKRLKLRVPRPMGVTALCHQLNQEKNEKNGRSHPIPTPNHQKLRNQVIKLYINYYLNNQLLSYDNITNTYRLITNRELSGILNMGMEELLIRMAKEVGRIGNLFEQEKEGFTRGLILKSLNWGSETEALAGHQLQILMAAQGSTYVPFLTSEVNKAMANRINANKPTLEVLKLLLDKHPMNLTVYPTDASPGTLLGNKKEQYITIDTAHKMINDGANGDLNNAAQFIPDDTLKLLPETNPNYQGGDILRGQSLSKGAPEGPTSVPNPTTKTDKAERLRGISDIEDYEDFTA